MLEAVGEHVAEVIRSGSSILEYMTQSGLFDFYDAGLGLDIANRQFARMVAQMAHRYPHMKVFEIGMLICFCFCCCHQNQTPSVLVVFYCVI